MKHRKSIQQFYILNQVSFESSQKFDSPQELANWFANSLGFPTPTVPRSVDFSKWLWANNLSPNYRLRYSLTEENNVEFDEAYIAAQERFLTICNAWGDDDLMMDIHADLVAVWEGR